MNKKKILAICALSAVGVFILKTIKAYKEEKDYEEFLAKLDEEEEEELNSSDFDDELGDEENLDYFEKEE